MARMKLDEAVDEGIAQAMTRDERILVMGEDVHMLRAGLYTQFGLSGELAAAALEAGLTPRYGRVAVDDTLPFARDREAAALPNVDRIVAEAKQLCR